MPAVALSPKAGAHGELCGMMAIKAAIEASGEGATRNVVLVPESAHGTNPATAALIGFTVEARCRRATTARSHLDGREARCSARMSPRSC